MGVARSPIRPDPTESRSEASEKATGGGPKLGWDNNGPENLRIRLEIVVWGWVGTGLGSFGPHSGPKSSLNDPDRTSDNLKLQAHELQPHP